MLNNDIINNDTPIKQIIEHLQIFVYNHEVLTKLKDEILNKMILASKDEKRKLCKEYKVLKSKEMYLDYNKLMTLFSFNINSINKKLKKEYEISFIIDDTIENQTIYKSLGILKECKWENININIVQNHTKTLEKKL